MDDQLKPRIHGGCKPLPIEVTGGGEKDGRSMWKADIYPIVHISWLIKMMISSNI